MIFVRDPPVKSIEFDVHCTPIDYSNPIINYSNPPPQVRKCLKQGGLIASEIFPHSLNEKAAHILKIFHKQGGLLLGTGLITQSTVQNSYKT